MSFPDIFHPTHRTMFNTKLSPYRWAKKYELKTNTATSTAKRIRSSGETWQLLGRPSSRVLDAQGCSLVLEGSMWQVRNKDGKKRPDCSYPTYPDGITTSCSRWYAIWESNITPGWSTKHASRECPRRRYWSNTSQQQHSSRIINIQHSTLAKCLCCHRI